MYMRLTVTFWPTKCNPAYQLDSLLQIFFMEPTSEKRIDSPAWQHPAPGNEQNDRVQNQENPTIKNGGNSRVAEDDPDLSKQPYRDPSFKNRSAQQHNNDEEWKEDYTEDPNEQAIK